MTTYVKQVSIDIEPGLDQGDFDAAIDKMYAALASDTRITTVDLASEGTGSISLLFTADRLDGDAPDGALTVALLDEGLSAAPELAFHVPDFVDEIQWGHAMA